MKISSEIKSKIDSWLNGSYDNDTKNKIKEMIDNEEEKELIDSFYKDLEFGTGGLRGIMGVGSNRMNNYTVGMATQGLANYVLSQKKDDSTLSVALGFDSRNNSKEFANRVAEILSSNGMNVYLYDDIRPISLLSYAVRKLNCMAGIVITASHNPKEYNGYKVYWSDGAQVISPHDKNIIDEVSKVKVEDIKLGDASRVKIIGEEIESAYIDELKNYLVSPLLIKKHSDIKIVYTPIHGSGYKVVPTALKSVGFNSIISLEDIQKPDGNFPTVESPNPEEAKALKMAIDKAKEVNAELVMGTDPDCDRMGCAILNSKNEYEILSGNQIGSLFAYYILSNKKNIGKNPYIVKTIVTTELAKSIAESFNIDIYDTLTGFKWIADKIENKKDATYLLGFEESFGYLINENVRDKDGVSSCVMLAEIAAYCKEKSISIIDYLDSVYEKYGFYYEETVSITKKGSDGAKEINDMMSYYRNKTISDIEGIKVVKSFDYENKVAYDNNTNEKKNIDLPKSNVLQYILEDSTKITVRPSGTEPKIKFYFEVCIKEDKSKRVGLAKEKIAKLKSFIKE